MSVIRAGALLLLVVALQVGLGRIWPAAPGWIDFHALPVIAYAMRGSQGTAMWVGCASGLLQDAWLHAGIFGLNGFKKTLLGWTLAGLNTRLDMQGPLAQFVAGVAFSLLDAILDPALRGLIDRAAPTAGFLQIVGRALIAGLLTVIAFRIVDRVRGSQRRRRR